MQCRKLGMPFTQAELENHQTYVPKRDGFFSRRLMPEEIKINVRLFAFDVVCALWL